MSVETQTDAQPERNNEVETPESMQELFESSLQSLEISPGSIIKGTILEVAKDYVVVSGSHGLKSESIVPRYEFDPDDPQEPTPPLEEGQVYDFYLEVLDNGLGETCLSREKAKKAVEWRMITEAFEEGGSIKGTILDRVKGGFSVRVGSVRGFLPGSQVDIRPSAKQQEGLIGQEMEFKIVKIDKKRSNLVVSRRSMLESQDNTERSKLLESLEVDAVVKGTVKNLTDYGAFIDLGGIDGLLHITDMSWKRVKNPSDIISVGDEIDIKILSYDKEKRRVSLGLKQLNDDPWVGLVDKYPVGRKVFGKVTNVTEYGCFVEIGNTIEGLVHMSEMDWTNKNVNPSKVVQVGQEIEVMVLEIDRSKRRISLGIKQCLLNPWEEFSNNHEKGEQIKGVIKTITDFGVFIGLPGDIDGLIHATDLSWSESGENIVRQMKKGEEVTACILSIDSERERVSLGVKQMTNDPFAEFCELNPKGTKITVTLLRREAQQAIVKVNDAINGCIKLLEVPKNTQEGETFDAYVMLHESRNFFLPLTTIEPKHQSDAPSHYKANISSRIEPKKASSLGSLIKDKLSMNDQDKDESK